MPELPEVETIRRGLEPLLVGRTLVEGWGHPSPKFAGAPDAAGQTVHALRRRGKYLLFDLDADELVLHLGMTGQLAVVETVDDGVGADAGGGAGAALHVRAWWRLDDGRTLRFRDIRRFGRLGVVAPGDHRAFPTLAAQGPEPWDVVLDGGGFWRNLRRSRARVKTQLLSQRPIAGVGNIYADEALWRAGVNPAVRALSRPRSEALLAELRSVLQAGIDNHGTTLRDYRTVEGRRGRHQFALRCYGRAGEPCDRCGAELRRRVLDGRATTWCPTCQHR